MSNWNEDKAQGIQSLKEIEESLAAFTAAFKERAGEYRSAMSAIDDKIAEMDTVLKEGCKALDDKVKEVAESVHVFDQAKEVAIQWQEKALAVARNIIDEQEQLGSKIDIMHQLNMAGFREPGMLYKINDERIRQGKKRIPLIWGPMTGYGSIPFPFMLSGGLKFTAFYSLKNTLNLLQLIMQPRVRKMVKYSDKLIAATPEMKNGIDTFYNVDIEHINETGCVIKNDETSIVKKFSSDGFKVLWVGRFMYTKQLEIALKVMGQLTNLKNLEFHIVGKGFTDEETQAMRDKAVEYGAEKICHWHGQIPNSEVHKLMRESDIFFFTSIFEATSTVILEAIQNGLPIVCFDRCGFGPIVDDSIGMKIPCKSPKQAVRDFVKAITYLYNHREVLPQMSANCKSKRLELSWDNKMTRLMSFYRKLVYGIEFSV